MRFNQCYQSLSNIRINGKAFHDKKTQELLVYNLKVLGFKKLGLKTFNKKNYQK